MKTCKQRETNTRVTAKILGLAVNKWMAVSERDICNFWIFGNWYLAKKRKLPNYLKNNELQTYFLTFILLYRRTCGFSSWVASAFSVILILLWCNSIIWNTFLCLHEFAREHLPQASRNCSQPKANQWLSVLSTTMKLSYNVIKEWWGRYTAPQGGVRID